MYNSQNFTELIVKERQRQLVAEADRLCLIKAAKSTKTNNRKRNFYSIFSFVKGLGAYLLRKHEPSICGCAQD